jgi:hypothetical protein
VRAVNTSGVVGPVNSNTGTSATTLYVQPGDFNIGTILYDISTAQEITGALIANETITNVNIAAQAVASANIQNAAIATAQIQSGAVTATQIAAASITTACITNAAITTALIANGAIGTAQIQFAAITSALIANEAVGTAQIQQAAIGYAQIATAAVGTLTIGGNAVTTQASYTLGNSGQATYQSGGGVLTVFLSAQAGAINQQNQVASTVVAYINGQQVAVWSGIGEATAFGLVQPAAGGVTVEFQNVATSGGTVSSNTGSILVFEAKR